MRRAKQTIGRKQGLTISCDDERERQPLPPTLRSYNYISDGGGRYGCTDMPIPMPGWVSIA